MTTIFYNSGNPFSGIAPTPLARRSVEMVRFGERWGQIHLVTLEGVITGCDSLSGKVTKQNQLVSGFRYDFQALEIKDNSTSVLFYKTAELQSVSFGESNLAFSIPFTVELRAFPSGYFTGDFGILNPVNKFDFSESEDGIVSLNHSVSCQGFNTATGDSNAFTNAASWVNARTGWNSQVLPVFISGYNPAACLRRQQVNQDRLNATYEVVESYESDTFRSGVYGNLRYTTDFSSGIEDGICSMNVNGTIRGCKVDSISGARAIYTGFSAFNEAIQQFKRITNRSDLSQFPVSKSVSEDTNGKTLDFSYSYNDDLRPKINIVYNISFDYSYLDDVITATIQATLSNRDAYNGARWIELKALAASLNLYSVIVPSYNSYVTEMASYLAAYPLNPNPISKSRTDNEYGLEITLSESYSNSDIPPVGLKNLNYTMSFVPSLHKYQFAPILDALGQYYFFDLNYISRGKMEINASAIGELTTPAATIKSILAQRVQGFQAVNLVGVSRAMDGQTLTEGNESFSKQFTIAVQYSALGPEFSLT